MNQYLQKLVKQILFASLFVLGFSATAQKLKLSEPKVEYQDNPLSIETLKPRFSWKLISTLRNTTQSFYEVRVGTSIRIASGKDVTWKGSMNSDQSVHIVYEGPELQFKQKYYWQVRAKDNHGNTSAWTELKFWQMGMKPADWTAKWITVPGQDTSRISPIFRKEITLKKEVRSAMAYITAKGLYDAEINGKRVSDSYFAPGWTSYAKRLQYQVYDVTASLKKGNNAIGVTLGDGWYKGYIGFATQRNFYGTARALLLQIAVTYTDGTRELVETDESWKSSKSPILVSDIYSGEYYDSRLEKTGWTSPGYKEDGTWAGVQILSSGTEELVSMSGPPVKKHEQFKPLKIFKTPEGETVVDFGQNLVGWVLLKAKGPAGTKITVSHAEVLDKAGNFYTANLRSAKQQNTYILNGTDGQVFEPHFTFQGFRYARVEGFPGDLKAEDLTAVALYSDMKNTGNFTSSNQMVNQLQHNIQWGQKGNFLDVPTDCPQRDERLGWTGDAQAFYTTAAYNMDVAGFFTKWLKDLKADQLKSGSVTHVVPNVLGQGWAGAAGWGDASTIIPWQMYVAYGDKRILEDQYESMKGWVGFITSNTRENLWNTGAHFGDWLFYRPEDDNDGRAAVTDKYLIAQTYYANSVQIMIHTAEVLGKKEDAQKYTEMLIKIKKAFVNEYLTPNGRMVSGSQTAYVLALQFDMLPEDQRQQAAQRLARNVRDYGNHLTTGFLGTPYLCHVLSRFGYSDVAYDLLLQESYPSWLYPVKMGATTIWERWDGIKPDGSFQTISMNSFNHYSYGAVGDWMYRSMAGINSDASGPGYKKIRIAPKPGRSITNVSADLETAYGMVRSSWKIEGGLFKLDVTIPPNTTATVVLPQPASRNGANNSNNLDNIKEIGSGSYHFEYTYQ
ncbi:glycoside hydrolase family 78 protein [Pedobacter metabolipauper]|uniref:alpha-L-rhamnosidase n=1 Tax=Pedobacter metabolipauper TaxID=425513 RepID=A0A4V3D0Q8_9SPHI|nr:glycoside hydrolase family 78 protein [Pedobacter metabolipauper]TDQ06948.1 alpha-L-rhamnosidase [Pedobacter metabolipauper]